MGPLRGNEKAEYILKYVCSTNREKESESIRKVDGAPKPHRGMKKKKQRFRIQGPERRRRLQI